jgi:hypothetical protein
LKARRPGLLQANCLTRPLTAEGSTHDRCCDRRAHGGDLAALAKGGRTNFVGFLLRLAARLPFLFIGGRFYGPKRSGRFASALVVVELTAMLCTMGEKRGLASGCRTTTTDPGPLVADGIFLALLVASVCAFALWLVPAPMFPSGNLRRARPVARAGDSGAGDDRDHARGAGLSLRHGATVRARAIVEPWTISIMAGAMAFVAPQSGLSIAYLVSIYAALATAAWPFLRTYGSRAAGARTAAHGPADRARAAACRSRRDRMGHPRLDLFILGLFAAPSAVGVYYVAQQVASLPQKLKTSFEPILGRC